MKALQLIKSVITILGFLLLLVLQGTAQEPDRSQLDLLISKLPTLPEDSNKVKLYIQIIQAAWRIDTTEASRDGKAALKLAHQIGWERGQANVLSAFGRLRWK